jgi:enoyl-CoA hydratase/carnithine racemase
VKTGRYNFLDVEVRDGVAIATMHHPDFSHDERDDWVTLVDEVRGDDDVRSLVITGWGNPKQGPVPGMFEDFDAFTYYERARLQPLGSLIDLDKPVVMALDGNPGVMSIPLTGDILIAERQVTFSDPHVLIGTASATQPYLWPLNSGLLRAKKYILTGKSFDAEEALAMGLVSEVVDTGQALTTALE